MITENSFNNDLNELCDRYGIVGLFGLVVQNTGAWQNITITRPIDRKNIRHCIAGLSQSAAYFQGMHDSFRLLDNRSFRADIVGNHALEIGSDEMPH